MSNGFVDDLGGYEEEGVAAFNRMADAMQALQSRLDALDADLGGKVGQAGQVVARAETAAAGVTEAARHAEAVAHMEARQTASWAVLGALAAFLVGRRGRILARARARQRARKRPGERLQGCPRPERRRVMGQPAARASQWTPA